MLYNAELVSAEQQSESAIRRHMSPVFWIPFPFWSLQGVRRDPCGTQDVLITLIILLFSVLFIVSVVCIYVNPNLPILPTPLPLGIHTLVLCVCVSTSTLQIRYLYCFSRFHICVLICDICFSLSDLTSLCVTASRSIHSSTNDPILRTMAFILPPAHRVDT